MAPVRTPVYLDHHATTPLDPAVLERMTAVLRDHFGNPSSKHAFGWAAAALLQEARERVAALLDAPPDAVILVSGATEANNLALKGLAAARGETGRIVVSPLEHPSVREPLGELAAAGWEVTELPCGSDGIVDPDDVARALARPADLVVVLAAQNEIGTLQPVAAIAALCRERGVPLHVDAAQAAGKVPLPGGEARPDLVAVSAHKLYGPKGSGALVVPDPRLRRRLRPLLTGGGQEQGLRAGTPAVADAVGLGEACRVAAERAAADAERLDRLGRLFLETLREAVPDLAVNGHPVRRLPGSWNLRFPGTRAAEVMRSARTLALSTGAACSSEEGKVSPVLLALGLSREEAASSLRICLGRFTTEEETLYAAERLAAAVRAARRQRSGRP